MIGFFNSKRIISGLIAGLFGLLIIFLGGWIFAIAVGVIVHLALLEFFRMAEFTGIRPATKTTLFACQLLLLTTQWQLHGGAPTGLTAAVLPLSGAAICGWLLLQPVTGSIADIAASIFGLFYLGFLPSHWLKLRSFTEYDWSLKTYSLIDGSSLTSSIGMKITLASCLMIVACDIGAYFFGRIIGKNLLSPISPSKTIEGAIAGIFCSCLVGVICGYLIDINNGIFLSAVLGILVGIFALVGDLTESMMKRDAGLKDSGDVLPGHGGVLDRIDSYLFTPAVVFYFIFLILPLI
tara:strand:+ start:472 stop:1353 length:882 start_codon:yes stop_codon:yes gene_type:complete